MKPAPYMDRVRWIEYLLCRAGIEVSKNIRICVKVLSENISNKKTGAVTIQPVATNAELNAMLNQVSQSFSGNVISILL